MEFTDYQIRAGRTINRELTRDETLKNAALGLAGEAGEFADIVKKIFHQGHIFDDIVKDKMKKELGDILWYVAEAATVLKVKLDDIAIENIDKLIRRYPGIGFNPDKSINRQE